ncbi:hypothetical protein GDH07_01735 [Pseudomonas sp. MC042]|uniref:Uncharacterized protein n=1 Tax=Pseudomonas piscis TaxID=2614538 RepID=A0A7X1U281_9PSED|nr:hypothetical protein [Pseudomonas piscis]POA52677.1 hypothetical protein C1889_21550 [Pseudomonas sp. FW507-12TSA]
MLICVNLCPGEKWQGSGQLELTWAARGRHRRRPLGTLLRGRYASIRAPLNTHSCDVKRSQDDHELFESSVDDQSCPD